MMTKTDKSAVARRGLASGFALALFAAPLGLPAFTTGTAQAGLLNEAHAAESSGGKGAMGGQKAVATRWVATPREECDPRRQQSHSRHPGR